MMNTSPFPQPMGTGVYGGYGQMGAMSGMGMGMQQPYMMTQPMYPSGMQPMGAVGKIGTGYYSMQSPAYMQRRTGCCEDPYATQDPYARRAGCCEPTPPYAAHGGVYGVNGVQPMRRTGCCEPVYHQHPATMYGGMYNGTPATNPALHTPRRRSGCL